jgi:hypothetical protein
VWEKPATDRLKANWESPAAATEWLSVLLCIREASDLFLDTEVG